MTGNYFSPFLDLQLYPSGEALGCCSWWSGFGWTWKVPGCLDWHFLVPSTWFYGCPVKVPGTLDLIPWLLGEGSCFLGSMVAWIWFLDSGALGLVPWWPGKGSRLPGSTSWSPEFDSMVALWRCLVHWTWFHGCLVKVPGCQDSVPGSLNLVLMVAWWSFLVAWIWFLACWACFHGVWHLP